MRGAEHLHAAGLPIQDVGAQAAGRLHAQLLSADQVDRDVVLEDADVRMLGRPRGQGGLDGPAGAIFGVQDAAVAVTAFAREVEGPATVGAREFDPALHQPADAAGAASDGELDGIPMAQPGACFQRIGHVRLDRVLRIDHRGQSALCPERAAAFKIPL